MTSQLTASPAWRALQQHRADTAGRHVADMLDAARVGRLVLSLDGLHLNYAAHDVSDETLKLLVALARQQQVEGWRDRMLSGDKINNTEDRAVLHTALRQQGDQPVLVDGKDVMPDIRAVQQKMEDFVERVRSGAWKGATGKPIRHIVNIGIGGSDLGPRMVVEALAGSQSVPQVHFVANADAHDIQPMLDGLDPAETLFVVVSKTFTTQETLLNANRARAWLTAALGDDAVSKHFVAASSNVQAVKDFGIDPDNIYPLWDWVGGRYSLWSSVGLSIALGLGMDQFKQLLAGAAAMDRHFATAPLEQNLPVLMAMLGVWQQNFHDTGALAILPYDERLRDLPRFLQQLDMESNGKSVTRDGQPVDYETGPVIFGECGTISQHSFHQLLHQGPKALPADFIVVAEDDLGLPEHHQAVLTNAAAQIGALALGDPSAAVPQNRYSGNRPSTLIKLDRLDPYHLGMLLALYEHKVFVQGVVWNINSFDQPGVELGKQMAKALVSGAPVRPDKRLEVTATYDHWIKSRTP
ncbi:MAG: glucose-6-phosphate isomerase [Alphaproteobacteria bacterium]|nr:glucose-6-phosphate isomerase [Alphaproteobacteria bacterium]MBV8549573.1 glucose-6-phosphate isomerase [Alphaproteobacteria bacterium]